MDKQIIDYTTRIWHNIKNEQTMHSIMDKAHPHHGEQKKPDTKESLLHESIYMKLKNM